ncbi:MAG: NAD-dependent epimerase/dehydratase family protein [Caulobacterales bacterium]
MAKAGRSAMRVVLTGASGFLGRAVALALDQAGFDVRAAGRAPVADAKAFAPIGDLRGPVDWRPALEGCDVVVHLAAIAHRRARPEDLEAVNARAPAALAKAAADVGVQRLVFASSVKAVGEDSGAAVWTEDQMPAPSTAYGRAKRAAEIAILKVAGLEVIVLRPPLVHGADARANFARLLELAALPLPPPLGGIANRRSLISKSGLAARIAAAAVPGAPTGVFFVTEDPPMSTSDVMRALRRGLGRSDALAPAPPPILRVGPLRQIYGSLAVTEAKFRAAFPGFASSDAVEALEETARDWARARGR